jgi:hypothetical protein
LKWVRAIRNKKNEGGRDDGLQRSAHAPVLGVGHDEAIARAIGLALGQNLSASTLTVNQNRLAGQLLMGNKSFSTWNEEEQAAVHALLKSEQGAGLVAKWNAAASVAKIMSFKLTAEYVKAVVSAAAGLPRDKPLNDLGLGRTAAALELLSKSAGQATFVG